jgi:hypothetical protein
LVIKPPNSSRGFAANIAPNSPHTLIAGVDYQNDRFVLFVDPDASDFYSRDGGAADVKTLYSGSDALTRFSLNSTSGHNAGMKWDDLGVATTFEEAMVIPEPHALSALCFGLAALSLTRPRHITQPSRLKHRKKLGMKKSRGVALAHLGKTL